MLETSKFIRIMLQISLHCDNVVACDNVDVVALPTTENITIHPQVSATMTF